MNWITRRTYSIYKIRNCISILTLSTPIPTSFHSFSAFPHLYPFSPNTSWNVCNDINTGYHQLGPVYLSSFKILESSSSWFAYPLFGNFVWVWLKSWTRHVEFEPVLAHNNWLPIAVRLPFRIEVKFCKQFGYTQNWTHYFGIKCNDDSFKSYK